MLLPDTDSMMYKTETENVFEVFYKNKELYEVKNYSKESN